MKLASVITSVINCPDCRGLPHSQSGTRPKMEWSGEVNSYLYYVVGLTLFAVWFYVRYEQTYWKRNDLKTPPYHFLVGHSLPRITKEKSVWELFDGYYQTYKRSADMIGLYLLTEPSVLLFDLDLIKRVMITDFDVFTTRGVYVNEKDDPISAHLFSIGGDKWRNLRKKLSPTFTSGKMKTMFPTIVALSNNFCSSFEEIVANNPSGFMIKDVTSRFTTDVIGNCAFGIECNSLSDPQNQFRTMGDKFFRRSFVRSLSQLFMVNFPAFSNRIGLKSTPEDVSEFFTQTVVDTVKYREENKVNRKDFLDLLLKIRNDESEANQLTIQEIVSQSFIFFVAGYETSSSTMMFCLFELAKRPEIQSLARKHIVEVLKKHDGELTYECLQDMDYLDKVVYGQLWWTSFTYAFANLLSITFRNASKIPCCSRTEPKSATRLFFSQH